MDVIWWGCKGTLESVVGKCRVEAIFGWVGGEEAL